MTQGAGNGGDRDFIRVGRSRIQGQGVFAKRKIPKGTRIIEYEGERQMISTLLTGLEPLNVYMFYLNEGTVIDGSRNGNDARFINHSCDPNCEVYCFDERIYIYAMHDIIRGMELTFDYQLRSISRDTKGHRKSDDDACLCGSPNCRGTMRTKRRRKSDNAY